MKGHYSLYQIHSTYKCNVLSSINPRLKIYKELLEQFETFENRLLGDTIISMLKQLDCVQVDIRGAILKMNLELPLQRNCL